MVGKDAYHIKICARPFHVLHSNKMLLCTGADSLSSRMCHLFSNSIDVAGSVNIGQVLINIWAKGVNKAHVIEAIRRLKFKFAGRQNIIRKSKWGFTIYPCPKHVTLQKAWVLIADGNIDKVHNRHGWLERQFVYEY